MATGWAAHPYAPRSTAETRHAMSYRRYRVPMAHAEASCPHCQGRVFAIPGDPSWFLPDGGEVVDSGYRVDCEPDVAGVPPTATEHGSGILHVYVCQVPRPLPPIAVEASAPMVNRSRRSRE
jgi:hypothetical protein